MSVAGPDFSISSRIRVFIYPCLLGTLSSFSIISLSVLVFNERLNCLVLLFLYFITAFICAFVLCAISSGSLLLKYNMDSGSVLISFVVGARISAGSSLHVSYFVNCFIFSLSFLFLCLLWCSVLVPFVVPGVLQCRFRCSFFPDLSRISSDIMPVSFRITSDIVL